MMSSRSDEYYGKRYDEDEKWYNDFINSRIGGSYPTPRQLETIRRIEQENPFRPKFTGVTIGDASNYISEYGKK